MKKLLIYLTVLITACSNQKSTGEQGTQPISEQAAPATEATLNAKWKADDATKKNVEAMIQLVNDSSYASPSQSEKLYSGLQVSIDKLVRECTMQGPAHEALHAWLEKVLKDMKELKEGDDEYSETYSDLKRDIELFQELFE
jgi:hypothetical protein